MVIDCNVVLFSHNSGILEHQIKVLWSFFTFSLGWKQKLYSCNFSTIILCSGHLFVLLCPLPVRITFSVVLLRIAFTRIRLLLSDAVYFFPGLHGSAEVWASFCVSGIRAVDVDVGASWSISSSAVAEWNARCWRGLWTSCKAFENVVICLVTHLYFI